MSSLKNSVRLVGNVGNAPEIVNLESGKKVAKFSLATNEVYKNAKGEKETSTEWHNIVAWGKTAEIIENYVKKGGEVAVDGKITYRTYETKEGEKRYTTEILVQEVLLLGGAK
jgi:single-strand DNA-binding protein